MEDHPKIQVDASGNLYLNFGSYGQEIEVACFSGDGTRLLTVEKVGVAHVWDVSDKQPRQIGEIAPISPLTGTKEGPTTYDFEVYIEAAALDQTGKFALLGLNDGTAGVFDVSSGERLSTLHIAEEHVYGWELIRAVAYSPDSSLAVVGFYDRCVGVWDRTGEKLVAKLTPQQSMQFFGDSTWGRNTLVSSVAVTQDNRYVFVGCADMSCTIWDLETLAPVMSATEHIEDILATRMVGDVITWVTTGGAIWRYSNGRVVKLLETNQHLNEAAISSDGNVVLMRSSANEILKTLITGECEILAKLDFSGDSDYTDRNIIGFKSSAHSDEVYYPDSNTTFLVGSERCFIDCEVARQITISSDNSIITTIAGSGTAGFVYHTGAKKLLRKSTCYVMAQAISPNSRIIAEARDEIGAKETILTITSVSPDNELEVEQTLNVPKVEALLFSADGKYLYSAAFHSDATIRRWKLQTDEKTFQQVAVLRRPGLSALKELANGNIALLRSSDGLEVWSPDLSTKVSASKFKVEFFTERSWSISNDQRHCVIGSDWSSLSIINLETGELTKITPPYVVPSFVPDSSLRVNPPSDSPNDSEVYKPDDGLQPTSNALLWTQSVGSFLHQSDGPRGWIFPLTLSKDGLTIVPCRNEIAVVSISADGQKIRARFAFNGKMRAGVVVGNTARAVNSKGQIFTHEIPIVGTNCGANCRD